jgi:Fur family peroxide stress response transcriptional regulator
VYRVLETLVEQGFARKVHHPGAVVRFDPATHRHHHLVCERCGSLADVEGSSMPEFPVPNLRGTGFRVHDYSISFTGLCRNCRQARPAAMED